MRKSLLLLIFCATVAAAASASAQLIQHRFLPEKGERGKLGPTQQFPFVAIGKNVYQLAPGARIMDDSNRTLVHAQIPPGREIVFLRDQAGNVLRIYILSPQELAALAQSGRR